MRRIKFRVFDRTAKHMHIVGTDQQHDHMHVDIRDYEVFYYNYQCGEGSITYDEDIHETVGGFVLMQYTGLKDKNGKEIYEGDIVKCYTREKWAIETGVDSKLVLYGTGEVVWFENECGFGIKGQDPTFLGWYECFEIIGNIYENPDLLNKQI